MIVRALRPLTGTYGKIQAGQLFNCRPEHLKIWLPAKLVEIPVEKRAPVDPLPAPIAEQLPADGPLVSCIMPTHNRREFIPRAIRCFLSQTHRNKELIIVDDGTEKIIDLIPRDPSIHYVREKPFPSLGAKRNFCIGLALGQYIAHWDDDDWSHPDRIKTQLTGEPILTGFQNMLFWDWKVKHGWLYKGVHCVLGTSLFYRRDFWEGNRFGSFNVGEDNHFVADGGGNKFIRRDQRFDMMVATNHNRASHPRRITSRWSVVEKDAIPEDYWRMEE